jgi:Transglycosylase SLT domain
MAVPLDCCRGWLASVAVERPCCWPLAVALAASTCYAGVFVTAAKADGHPVDTSARAPKAPAVEAPEHDGPTQERSPDNGQEGVTLPSVGEESPINRRDSRNRPPVGRADDRSASAPPAHTYTTPRRARVGVPNVVLDRFGIPPFLVPIYQAAGMQHGIRWEILAAINEIETGYGRNLNISSAGAVGWMQFMPATWAAYGVDANLDGDADPYNPVDAIFAAARYLEAAGARTDIRKAVFAYNHASWYVDSVLMRAQAIGGVTSDVVGSLTGLVQGRFPAHGKATYTGLGELSRTHAAPKDRRRAERADHGLDRWAAGAIRGLPLKQRLFANPARPAVRAVLQSTAG